LRDGLSLTFATARSDLVPPTEQKIPRVDSATLAATDHFATMSNSPSYLKHLLALLFALIPLAAVVGACVACP